MLHESHAKRFAPCTAWADGCTGAAVPSDTRGALCAAVRSVVRSATRTAVCSPCLSTVPRTPQAGHYISTPSRTQPRGQGYKKQRNHRQGPVLGKPSRVLKDKSPVVGKLRQTLELRGRQAHMMYTYSMRYDAGHTTTMHRGRPCTNRSVLNESRQSPLGLPENMPAQQGWKCPCWMQVGWRSGTGTC